MYIRWPTAQRSRVNVPRLLAGQSMAMTQHAAVQVIAETGLFSLFPERQTSGDHHSAVRLREICIMSMVYRNILFDSPPPEIAPPRPQVDQNKHKNA